MMTHLKTLFYVLLLACFTSFQFANADDSKQSQKAILITGASSGIGLSMTKLLSQNGFYIYAGVLHKEEMAALDKLENVKAVQFDVRNQAQIDAAVKVVEGEGKGLYGLINNAGVSIFGPMLELPVEQVKYQMDVNVYGPMRVSQAFAPLIMQSKGRIATTGSIAGILSPQFMGAYSMSKHAIEAYTDAFAQEMAGFGVSVHVIEPGNYGTNIGNAAKKRLLDMDYWPATTRYGKARSHLLGRLDQTEKGPDPIDVAEAALQLMQSENPKIRYMVTATPAQAEITLRRQLSKMLELNAQQKHELSRDQLIKLLDEELGKNQKK
ncbi:SDR family oxidoreductase [uncultured Pseudoteredinibacter sp.]|uniref:SDR family oxidoreductase n=1 Tax=uncultured Pseudoteredinibacter sp. TaxID=1641701 RepID=UPI00260D6C82|nr:SDR family oxidoreductase [uncultured Pseudoteredinibacter sp.]